MKTLKNLADTPWIWPIGLLACIVFIAWPPIFFFYIVGAIIYSYTP